MELKHGARLAILVSLLLHCSVHGILTRVPENLITLRGRDIVLYCHTNLTFPVHWDVDRVEQPTTLSWDTVYGGDQGVVLEKFEPRFTVSVDSSKTRYDLRITDVQPQDAGTYRCGDNGGLDLGKFDKGIPGYGATADVIVLEAEGLTCEHNIREGGHVGGGLTNPNQPPEMITVTCSVSYNGNVPPKFLWSLLFNTAKPDRPLNDFTVTSYKSNNNGNLVATSTLNLYAGGWLHDTNIKCELLAPGVSAPDPRSPSNSIKPFLSDKIFVYSVSLSSSTPPLYSSDVDSQLQMIKSNGTCYISTNIPCLTPLKQLQEKLNLAGLPESQSTTSSNSSTGIIIFLIILIILLAAAVGWLFILRRRETQRRRKAEQRERQHLLADPGRENREIIIPGLVRNNMLPFIYTEENNAPNKYRMITVSAESAAGEQAGVVPRKSNELPPANLLQISLGVASCILNDHLYIIGAGSNHNELWRYSLHQDEWTILRSMDQGRAHHSAVAVENRIYVIGGKDNEENIINNIEYYDVNADNWAELHTMNENGVNEARVNPVVCSLVRPVHSAAACVRGGNIYIFGGATVERAISEVQVIEINTETDTGTCRIMRGDNNVMPAAYDNMKAVVHRNTAIVIGRHACFVYNFDDQSFETRRQFKSDCDHFGLALHNQKLYIVGAKKNSERDRDDELEWEFSSQVKCSAANAIVNG